MVLVVTGREDRSAAHRHALRHPVHHCVHHLVDAGIAGHRRAVAVIGGLRETDVVDLAAEVRGQPIIPSRSHIRLASHATNDGARILRRGYSFRDGLDSSGEADAGLFFICYQRDPRSQFVRIQERLAEQDALSLYLIHTGSAIFACPPGAREGDWVGRGLFES